VRASLALPSDGAPRAVERGGPLTPYEVEEIVEDALHAGPGAALDVCVDESASDACLAHLHACFARLGARGIDVRLHRETMEAPR
jgi:hypothetical protein